VLIIAPVGGIIGKGKRALPVDRTLATARSIEFDTIVIAAGTTPSKDIKQVVMLQEAYRHCKALGGWGDGTDGLAAAGIPLDGPGILIGNSVTAAFTSEVVTALGLHRVWDRAEDVMASMVPPVN
jgi:catalase